MPYPIVCCRKINKPSHATVIPANAPSFPRRREYREKQSTPLQRTQRPINEKVNGESLTFLKRNGVTLLEVSRPSHCCDGDFLTVVTEFGGVRDCQRLDI